MTEIEKLYKLIENVAKDDTAMLDEIDAKVWYWLNGWVFSDDLWAQGGQYLGRKSYSTSIDAQEQIDTDGWEFYMTQSKGLYVFGGARDAIGTDQIESPALVTECLARLHLLLQVVEYEREEVMFERLYKDYFYNVWGRPKNSEEAATMKKLPTYPNGERQDRDRCMGWNEAIDYLASRNMIKDKT